MFIYHKRQYPDIIRQGLHERLHMQRRMSCIAAPGSRSGVPALVERNGVGNLTVVFDVGR